MNQGKLSSAVTFSTRERQRDTPRRGQKRRKNSGETFKTTVQAAEEGYERAVQVFKRH